MKYLIVHAHHEPNSFNGALTRRAHEVLLEDGHDVQISDLYGMEFDPVSDRRNFTTVADADYLQQQREEALATDRRGFVEQVETEIQKLEWCDVLIFQYPLWWFNMPAILKGWVDRVLAQGRAYGDGRWYGDGVFKGKRAMVSVTTGGPSTMYEDDALNPPMWQLLAPVEHGVFKFTGFSVLPAHFVWGPGYLDDEQRAQAIDDYGAHLRRVADEPGSPPPDPSEYPAPSFKKK